MNGHHLVNDALEILREAGVAAEVENNSRHYKVKFTNALGSSVLLRSFGDDRDDEVVLTTVVHCHNLLGRIYLRVISPFHYLVARSNLAKAARRGWAP
jgi:hypothetical protein